jgi:hypothetical protein
MHPSKRDVIGWHRLGQLSHGSSAVRNPRRHFSGGIWIFSDHRPTRSACTRISTFSNRRR